MVIFTDAKSQKQISKALTLMRTWRCTDILGKTVAPAAGKLPTGSMLRIRPFVVTKKAA